ncbi:MAG: phospho-N-acetylmuramoyl-pentapeptide-transferase, partial [Actinobacteria bacterium]|nr:phospho-N-acetylmuramoyl-pentapeptide-transferase [Actinomycetota bacterium]
LEGARKYTLRFGDTTVVIPWIYLVFVFFLMAGLSNSVNLTDGLDGLAGGTVMIAMAMMAAIAFRSNHLDVALFAAACAGACIGFLWFNCYPADIFMGDTGSLALGTALAGVAVITKAEVFSLIVGGIFVAEALSVVIQVVHFKRTGKRVFLMAPFHHHFEKKGWSETKVVIRFWIITGMLACIGFALYFTQSL